MTTDTFALATDPENMVQYIYQRVDEADKNHNHNDTSKANQGRIYQIPGKFISNITARLNCTTESKNLWNIH